MALMKEQPGVKGNCAEESVAFYAGHVAVHGRVALAPMSGYNDQPFRRLCRRFGASLVYTGLLSSSAIVYGPEPWGAKRTAEMLRLHPEEAPLAIQLFGSDEAIIVEAARRIQPLNAALLDLNAGCAKPKVTSSGAGAALMRDPARVGRIFAGLSRALQTPVSGKIRLGWDAESRNYLEVAQAMADNGAVLVAVHGRTADEAFRGSADWAAIARVKRHLTIPVLASGDVKRVADIERILDATGCDGVMIGRAAIGNPWIFAGRDRDTIPWDERLPLILEHLPMMLDFHGDYQGVQRFRKHLRAYLQSSRIPRQMRVRMTQCHDPDRLKALLEESPAWVKEGEPDDSDSRDFAFEYEV
jgi:tRNA-dihydrouridine synthase B